MRVAVMSDIHGFSLALDVVAGDIAEQGPLDVVVVAGDLCLVGPDPAGVLDRLAAQPWQVLQGNTDRDLVLAAQGEFEDSEFDYTLSQIGAAGVEDLAALPFAVRFTPPGGRSPQDDLLVCHANPHDLEQKLTPEMSDAETRAILGDTNAAAIAFGHHHVAYTRRLGDTLLVDVSAVGNPKDGDLRCKYALLAWSPGAGWSAEIRRLPYPLAATAAQMRASGMPNPNKALRKLERASYGSAR
ncbi:MAG: metallophosphoesterase family protein [Thermomicrobiales bacterium]|nr:metallophosphoesterase family protein [Thermomicrobiales bacterium]